MTDPNQSPEDPPDRRHPLRTLLRGMAWCGFFFILFMLLFFVLPVDQRLFRAALTQPVVHFTVSEGVPRFTYCNCGSTLRPDEVNELVAGALVATEDRRFRWHLGVDPLSLAKAVAQGGARGGSTIEMQLAKNSLNGDAPTISRKLVELFFATRIALSFDKRDTLRLYLSRVYFGQAGSTPVFGLRDAAWVYFRTRPEALDAAQAAILVAMLNAPNALNPLRNPQAVSERAALVLRRMRAEGYLDADRRVDVAAALPRDLARPAPRDRYLEDHVMREIAAAAPDLPDGFYRALTTIDPIAQEQAHRLVRREIKSYVGRGVERAGLITLDGKGRILAMVGGQNYLASSWNLAIQARRQAASTAKIVTYAAALEDGWQASSPLQDRREAIAGRFVPRNVDGRYKGQVTLETCLRESRNVCTMWLAQQLGMARLSAMARDLGLTDKSVPGAGIVLGAAETTLARNTAAFAALAHEGRLYAPYVLRGILGDKARVLHRGGAGQGEQVVSPETARGMTALLGAVTGPGGTGRAAVFRGGRSFGKTGTSQENRDAWFVGFADHGIATGIWVGPAEGRRMAGVAGGDLPARIFAFYNVNLVERFRGYAEGRADDPQSFWRDVNRP